MAQVIIYKNDENILQVIHPTAEILDAGYSVLQVANKDVPTGKPFKLIEETALPTDRALRAAWDWSGNLDTDNDGVGGVGYTFDGGE